MRPRTHPRSILLLVAGLIAACGGETPPVAPESPEAELAIRSAARAETGVAAATETEAAIRGILPTVERMAQRRREAVAPAFAHWYGHAGTGTLGGTLIVFQDRGDKHLESDDGTGIEWVPGDPRRGGSIGIGYAVSPVAAPPLSTAQTVAAIHRAMATWGEDTGCSNVAIESATFADADILHAGFVPLPAGVLGITISFAFIDGAGAFTDLDGDGNLDYAFALILYNADFPWNIDVDIDVETVALHEAGHGLAQAHFGRGFITLANGKGHLAPRAVMNASYTGVQQSLSGSDLAGHCSLWAAWPNN